MRARSCSIVGCRRRPRRRGWLRTTATTAGPAPGPQTRGGGTGRRGGGGGRGGAGGGGRAGGGGGGPQGGRGGGGRGGAPPPPPRRGLTISGRGGARPVEVPTPAGVPDGQRTRLAGQGGRGTEGSPPGALYLIVSIRPDRRYRV